MWFYCRQHQVAYASANQLNGHWLNAHKGEPRPARGDNQVDAVPPGTRLVEAKEPRAPRALRRPEGMAPTETPVTSPTTAATAAAAAFDDTPPVDEAARLDRMLVGIGCPADRRQLIVGGARVFPILLAHPANLANHLDGHLPANLKRMRDMLVYQFFQDRAEPEGPAPDAPMWVLPNRNGPPNSAMHPAWNFGPSNSPRSNGWDQGWNSPQWRQAKGEEPPEDPRITALTNNLQAALEALQEERHDRQREEAERREREREQAQEDRLRDMEDVLTDKISAIADLVAKIQEGSQTGRATAEQSEFGALKTELSAIRGKLEDEKTARLQDTIDGLKAEMAGVRARVDQGPTGKTTEDLISQATPSVMDRIEEVGNAAQGELRGIREALTSGKLPTLVANAPLAATPAESPVVTSARSMAAAKTLEDEILNLVNS